MKQNRPFHTEELDNCPDQGVVALIRRVLPEERAKIKHAKKMEWIQQCPYCGAWVGSFVEHVKNKHRDRNSRQIRTQCPHEECGRMGVDIKNHIRMVQDKVRNYSCEECHPTFSSSYQSVKHALSRMCQKMQNGNLMIEAHKNSS